MISYIKGELVSFEKDKVIVDVGGIGFGIYMPVQAMGRLPGVGKEVKLHTYLNVKEDAMQLFGFPTRDALELFKLLIGVNGIGPKGGLSILSQLSPDDLRFAVLSKDTKAISSAPGIGKKTAEKLILELKDKLQIGDTMEGQSSGGDASSMIEQEAASDAVNALTALGYGSTEALRAVRQVEIEENATVEEILKAALKFLL